jgi:hypothetical protein
MLLEFAKIIGIVISIWVISTAIKESEEDELL